MGPNSIQKKKWQEAKLYNPGRTGKELGAGKLQRLWEGDCEQTKH